MIEKLEFIESIPPLGLALSVIAFFFVLAIFRGVIQQIAGVLCILIACVAGWWVYRNSDHLLWGTINELDATWQVGVAALAGFVVYGILRVIAKILLSLGFGTLISGAFGKREGFG